eukprot:499388-Heterocapsa_arctica.AAC.1
MAKVEMRWKCKCRICLVDRLSRRCKNERNTKRADMRSIARSVSIAWPRRAKATRTSREPNQLRFLRSASTTATC